MWLTPQQVHVLKFIKSHEGRIIRSNYNSTRPNHFGEIGIHWKTLDPLVKGKMVLRYGRFYGITTKGLAAIGLAPPPP